MKRVSKKDIEAHIQMIERQAEQINIIASDFNPTKEVLTGSALAHALCKANIFNFYALVSDVSDERALASNHAIKITQYKPNRSNYFFNAMTFAVPVIPDGTAISSTVEDFAAKYL